MSVRWMLSRDLQEAAEITGATFGEYEDLLRNPVTAGFGIWDGESILQGLCFYRLDGVRFRILELAVHPDSQRKGVGTELLGRMVMLMRNAPYIEAIDVVVDETNLAGQLFLREKGFRAVGSERNGYRFEILRINSCGIPDVGLRSNY